LKPRWANNGDLAALQVPVADGDSSELIESGQHLLTITLLDGDRDIGKAIEWRPVTPAPGLISEFVGVHTGLGIEIRRKYRSGVETGTIEHEILLSGQDGHLPAGLRLQLHVAAVLLKHAPNDGSLGDAFYGYSRWLAATHIDGDFEPVREPVSATSAALIVRHLALIATTQSPGDASLTVHPDTGTTLTIEGAGLTVSQRQELGVLRLERSAVAGSPYRDLMYSDMWSPLRGLARLIERALEVLVGVVGNAGIAVILFALLLRAAMMPLGLWSIRQQRRFTEIQRQMKPKIEHINKTMKGAAKSERILEIYKEHGISPFSGLKGSLGLFVQLPILIALFAVTTESAMFREVPFLWFADLSLPDRTLALPFTIPGLGAYFNVLPILLGIVCVAAALILSRSASGSSPRAGLILALVFVVFFYSCAAALVTYWLVVNVSQIFEGMYVGRKPGRQSH
jgi:YidC/Oxa1 family membrane protein insertase